MREPETAGWHKKSKRETRVRVREMGETRRGTRKRDKGVVKRRRLDDERKRGLTGEGEGA